MRNWKPSDIPASENWAVVSYKMADINFYQEEFEDLLEDNLSLGYGLEDGNCGESFCSDDKLTHFRSWKNALIATIHSTSN